jgi:hypothetical protein
MFCDKKFLLEYFEFEVGPVTENSQALKINKTGFESRPLVLLGV